MKRVIGALNISRSRMSVSGQASAVAMEAAASLHPPSDPDDDCGTLMMIASCGLGVPAGGTDVPVSGTTAVLAGDADDVVIGLF